MTGVARDHGPITALIPDVGGPHGRGRHVFHDPASRFYAVQWEKTPGHIVHERHIPILDQGQLGSCTGNAGTGALGTSPFFETAPVRAVTLDQPFAVGLYGQATHLDDDRLTSALREAGRSAGFSDVRPVIELRGLCEECAG